MNSVFIKNELDWLAAIMAARLKLYFGQDAGVKNVNEIVPQDLTPECGNYCSFLLENQLDFEDRVFLIMSFVPYLKPQLLDCFNVKNSDTGQRFIEFGCEEKQSGGLQPTLETVLFVLAGDEVAEKIRLADYFTHHPVFSNISFYRNGIGERNSFSFWTLQPSEELLDNLILERPFQPHFSTDFPARLISTSRSWDELVLDDRTMELVNEIRIWVEFGEKTRKEWHLDGRLKPGYRALFYGLPGCGKTFTASLLGKATGKSVYCIDLSMVVSKYIGETEKNLAKVFEMAENKDWILFFDEADALFGKRTNVKDSHDRYANQEVAYLLQRIEDYRGLVVLSTNLKSNIDEAFARRFQSVIRFPMPDALQRERIWRETFSELCIFDDDVNLSAIAVKYELSGGSIVNVVQYCSVMAMSRGENRIRNCDLIEGIRREFQKEGKIAE